MYNEIRKPIQGINAIFLYMTKIIIPFLCLNIVGCASFCTPGKRAALENVILAQEEEIRILNNSIAEKDQLIKAKNSKIEIMRKKLESLGVFE